MSSRRALCCFVLLLLLTACSPEYPGSCSMEDPFDLPDVYAVARDDSLPFRFPLDHIEESGSHGWFVESWYTFPGSPRFFENPHFIYLTSDTYKSPAGTAVYAMTDGVVSYSGLGERQKGWLILIDHPSVNLYSLYDNLSPSRWHIKTGTHVVRGDLIGYLGDSWENGGSKEVPLEPHLRLGVRAGQTMDYPAKGPWRYQGGMIALCPTDVGWLQPSEVITGQAIPAGGYPTPDVPFLERWGFELLFSLIYATGGLVLLIILAKHKKWLLLVLPAVSVVLAWIVLRNNGVIRSYMVMSVGVLILLAGFYLYFRRSRSQTE